MNLYLPNQDFRPGFTYSERLEFAAKYSDEKWRVALTHLHQTQRCVISRSAIRIAEVIKKKLDIDLFPLIIPVATKGFNIGGGTAAFCMYDDTGFDYLFDMRASHYHSMRGEYDTYHQQRGSSLWIVRNK